MPPIFEAKDDYEIMYLLASKLGFADKMFKNIKVENNLPVAEDILREINRGGWSTGYCGQSPERLKMHRDNQKDFDLVSLRAADGPAKGDYYGLPWPCWGTPELKHPGTHVLYNTSMHVMDGGSPFRARFGVEYQGKTLLAEGSYTLGLRDQGRLSRVQLRRAQEARLGRRSHRCRAGDDRTHRRQHARHGVVVDSICPAASSASRLSHGVMHYGNGKARMLAFGLPDPIPVHREPIYTPRPDLVAKYPTLPDASQFRLPNIGLRCAEGRGRQGNSKSLSRLS